jgi:elongation factor Tu
LVTGDRPQFSFRTTDVTGSVTLPKDVGMCIQGDHATVRVELSEDKPIALDEGQRFTICESGRTVGSGVVTKILEQGEHRR